MPEPIENEPRRRRILVVDDNEATLRLFSILLQERGHEVRTAVDGSSAMDVAAAFEPDVVLLDIGMPGMDGCEVARRLRARSGGRRMALVALTGYGHDRARREIAEAGFDRHVLKGSDLDETLALLEEIE